MRITKMPCDHTHNHAWRVAHHISLHTRPTDWCKRGKRMTVDEVHFECRFVKPLWEIFMQVNGVSVNSIIPQTQQAFLEATLFQPPLRRRTNGVTWYTVLCTCRQGVRWLVCNDIIPKAIPLSERLTQCPHLAKHANTDKLIKLARIHWL